ncbi:Macrolide export ATP-binding/permease protein MacB [Corynebacterium canis]|nr:Macrolide export ATP-binding/permease protein MacB [Corynebacterium canis]
MGQHNGAATDFAHNLNTHPTRGSPRILNVSHPMTLSPTRHLVPQNALPKQQTPRSETFHPKIRKTVVEVRGGQRQRAAIARALVGERRLILADEPTGALDTTTGESVLQLLRTRVDMGAAGLLVTHEPRFAAYADRVVYLRDGHIESASQ